MMNKRPMLEYPHAKFNATALYYDTRKEDKTESKGRNSGTEARMLPIEP